MELRIRFDEDEFTHVHIVNRLTEFFIIGEHKFDKLTLLRTFTPRKTLEIEIYSNEFSEVRDVIEKIRNAIEQLYECDVEEIDIAIKIFHYEKISRQ